MAKSVAERQREYRARVRENGQKPVSFVLDVEAIDIITERAEQQGISKECVLNDLLKASVTSNRKQVAAKVWKQTSALSEDDLKEQANCIERLMTDKAQLSAQVQQLEKQLQKTKIASDSSEYQAKIDELLQINLSLVTQRDTVRLEANKLKTELESAKREPAKLKAELSTAKRELNQHKARLCQCLTASGHQCQKLATHENKHGGFVVWTCEQHYKSVINI